MKPEEPLPTLNLAIRADAMGVRHALIDVRDWLDARQVHKADVSSAQLVLAEVLNNIVEHALADSPQSEFNLRASHCDDSLTFKTFDDGCAMPSKALPLREMPSLDVPKDDLPEGGFGWPIFLTLAQDIRYDRQNDQNQLSFVIPCQPKI